MQPSRGTVERHAVVEAHQIAFSDSRTMTVNLRDASGTSLYAKELRAV